MGIGYSFTNSSSLLGGLLTIWKEEEMEVICSFKGEGYLCINFWKENKLYYLVNIYSSCFLNKKRTLWGKLLELKETFKDGEWIIGGDCNAIKNCNERKGRREVTNCNEMNLFTEFIEESRLVDISCKGKKFTWYGGDGKSCSRIDRFLVSDKVVND